MTTDTSTVVGVFNDYSSAEQAARALVGSGISRDAIHLQSSSRTTTAGHSDYGNPPHEGGIMGFFHNLFGSDDDSNRYNTAVETGRTVLTVDAAGNEAERAVALLNQHGAVDIDSDATDTGSSRAGYGTATATESGSSIPVVEEELRVGKRVVQRGGVRVYSRIVERPVEEQVTLHDEHVTVERRPVNRAVSESELAGLRDQSFEMTETAEEAVIEKRARVTEEVVVGKETTERTQKVKDTVRHTDVNVERIGNSGADYEEDYRADWQKNYAAAGGDYSAWAPSYQYGSRFANDARYKGRSWNEVEPEIRSSYERDYPGSTWDRMKNSVRYGWDKVTGQR